MLYVIQLFKKVWYKLKVILLVIWCNVEVTGIDSLICHRKCCTRIIIQMLTVVKGNIDYVSSWGTKYCPTLSRGQCKIYENVSRNKVSIHNGIG